MSGSMARDHRVLARDVFARRTPSRRVCAGATVWLMRFSDLHDVSPGTPAAKGSTAALVAGTV